MAEKKIDFMREIDEALEFSRILERCLREKEEQPTIYGDWVTEQKLRADKSKRILFPILMPPPVQALQCEKTTLYDKLDGIFVGLEGEKQINTICVRIASIRKLQGEWLKEEIEQSPELTEKLSAIDFGFDVGAHWYMLVFENLPKKEPNESENKNI